MSGSVEIDGSFGEGGGQILRTAVALSITARRPVRILNIRAGRPNPGLANQHLTCIKAAKQISSASVSGATLGSQTLEFEPGDVRPGDYSFDVTTAGSVSLVFHTLFLPLSLAEEESRITIRGGTHVKWSPSHEFLQDQWLFYLCKIGFDISLQLQKAGYYPKGGGVLKARVKPAKEIRSLTLTDRGAFRGVVGRVFFSRLKRSVATRQAARAEEILHSRGLSAEFEIREYPSPGAGTGTHLRAAFENGSGSYTSLGERGVPAERVAASSAESVFEYIDSGAAVDRFIADQLVLPLSFASGESCFTCEQVTQHSVTNAHVVQMFLPVEVEVDGEAGHPGRLRIAPQEGAGEGR
jgi:RNA 3'-phosphate cyclase